MNSNWQELRELSYPKRQDKIEFLCDSIRQTSDRIIHSVKCYEPERTYKAIVAVQEYLDRIKQLVMSRGEE